MSNILEGKIKVIGDVQTFDSGFTKREFVIETAEQYPQQVQFEMFKDATSKLDSFKVGDTVSVHFNVRGREYEGKYFTNLNAWRLEAAGQGQVVNQEVTADDGSGLPF